MLGLLSAGISGVGAIAGGLMGRSAAKNAAYAQVRGNNQAASQLQQGNSQAAQVLQPYSNEGAGARSLVNAALGVPQAQGGASIVADEQAIYQQLLQDRPDVAAEALKQSQSKKSQFYGSDPVSYAKYWVQNFGGQDALNAATQKVQAQAAPMPSGPAQTQEGASQVFQGTQFAKDANTYGTSLQANASKLGNALWQPVGGEQATFEQSPWRAMTDRATTKANDLFLGLAGAQGSVLSGNTARGLQENAASINDSMYGNYLNAYNNAATGQYNANNNAATGTYNANTDAFANWMNGLDGVSSRGFQADNTVAGNVVGQGNTLANIATGNGQARADGIMNASNATQNMIGGVFNAVGQGVQALKAPTTNAQQPKTNALYMGGTHSNGAPVRLRQQLPQPRFA